MKLRRSSSIYPTLLIFSLLTACIPSLSSVEPPTFRPVPESLTLLRLDPPGVGAGTATFRLKLEVDNPNAFALSVSKLDFTLFFNSRRTAQGSSQGVRLPPSSTKRLTLDITVALSEAPELLSDMGRLIAGEALPYRVEASATVEAFGLSRRLSDITLAEGVMAQPAAVTAPTFRYLPETSGLRELTLNRAVVAVSLELDNPTPFGYLFSAPAVALKLDGNSVAEAGVMALPVPAFSTATLTLQFDLRPAALGVALVRKLSNLSGEGLDLELSGRFLLELPGLLTRDFSVERLLAAVLK